MRLWAVIVGLAAAGMARLVFVPDDLQFGFNVALAVAVVGAGFLLGLSADEWGVEPTTWGAGLRWGAGTYLLVVAVTGMAAVSRSSLFEDERAGIGVGELVLRVMVIIPLGTVVMEELAFRGLLLSLARRMLPAGAAVVATSVLFGLWHLPGRWGEPIPTLVGVVVATSVAGLIFAWLRVRSGSLIAPILAHLATNTVPFMVAWLVAD